MYYLSQAVRYSDALQKRPHTVLSFKDASPRLWRYALQRRNLRRLAVLTQHNFGNCGSATSDFRVSPLLDTFLSSQFSYTILVGKKAMSHSNCRFREPSKAHLQNYEYYMFLSLLFDVLHVLNLVACSEF